MHIGFDIGPLVCPLTGVGVYTEAMLRHLLNGSAGDVSITGLSVGTRPPDTSGLPGSFSFRHIPIPTRAMYRIWEWTGRPRADLLTGNADVYHATNYVLPPVARARRVLTIYDLAFVRHPEWCSPRIVGYFSRNIRRFAHDADAILTCSEHTKQDIANLLDVDESQIRVAYGASMQREHSPSRERAQADVLSKYGIRSPFVLFVGAIEPRKNLLTLLRAFRRLAPETPASLVLAGPPGWGADPVFRAVRQLDLGARIVQTGYVSREDLASLYAAADLFAFPSWYEGFGLPVIEAMASGCPVVASNTSCLPEITDGAAVLVDPDDAERLFEAMARVLTDDSLRAELIRKGTAQAQKFSWDGCAEAVTGLYRELAC